MRLNSDQIRRLKMLQRRNAVRKGWETRRRMRGARGVDRLRRDMEQIDAEHGAAVARVLHGGDDEG